jgi:hypothetical protein
MGPGIVVIAGPIDELLGSSRCWSLPRALTSHYSPFLKAACERDFRERQENRIRLPNDDPNAFAIFVEWMYYGSYNLDASPVAATQHIAGLDAQAWVLGDKRLCTGFKNYAMTRLWQRYGTVFASDPVRPVEVEYACSNSAAGSKLRQLFFDTVSTHFTNNERVQGTAEEWDQVLQKHADARLFLLRGFSHVPDPRQLGKTAYDYFDKERNSEPDTTRLVSNSVVTPAKRNADGASVKAEFSKT